VTGDIRTADLTVNNKPVYEKGWLLCQDDPDIKKIVDKYPGRPGIPERF